MRKYSFIQPKTMDELFAAVKANADKNVRFVAGGTDFMPKLHTVQDSLPTGDELETVIVSLVDLGMNAITETEDSIKIGACAILNDIAACPIIQKEAPVLSQTINEMAGVTIRNIATIGGNICNASPAADSVPTMMALDATFVVAGPEGTKEIKACEFFKGPGKTVLAADEVLVEIVIAKGAKAAFVKQGRRKAETLSTVNAAACVVAEDGICKAIRVAVGSCAPTVVRITAVEEALIGKELTDEAIEDASKLAVENICPIDDIRSSAWYRNKIAPVMVKRAIKGAM